MAILFDPTSGRPTHTRHMNPDELNMFMLWREHAIPCRSCELSRQRGTPTKRLECRVAEVRYYLSCRRFDYIERTFTIDEIYTALTQPTINLSDHDNENKWDNFTLGG